MRRHGVIDPAATPMARVLGTAAVAAAGLVAVALAFSSLFDAETYEDWVALIGIFTVPSLLVVALQWHYHGPDAIDRLRQPWRGLGYLGVTLAGTIVGGGVLYFGPGHALGSTPMLIHAAIMAIFGAFWVIAVWRCWPFNLLVRGKVALGLTAWAASYVVGIGVFLALFNYAAMRHAPFYDAALDPGGPFAGSPALVYCVTTTALIVAYEKLFAYWPLAGTIASRSAPLHGLVTTPAILLLSAALMALFTGPLGFDETDFMVRGPIALIFGVFLTTSLTRDQVFRGLAQPARGWMLLALAIASGVAMEEMYRALAPAIAGAPLNGLKLDLWVATALLGVTFPLIVAFTGFFAFWPLVREGEPLSIAGEAEAAI